MHTFFVKSYRAETQGEERGRSRTKNSLRPFGSKCLLKFFFKCFVKEIYSYGGKSILSNLLFYIVLILIFFKDFGLVEFL